MISRDEAIKLVISTSKYAHALIVSAIMGKLAVSLCENSSEWELVGLLHDLDFDDAGGDMSKHGVVAAERLAGKLPEKCLYAIKAHDYRTRFKPTSRLDNALVAVDSLSILIEKAKKRRQKLNVETLETILANISSEEPWHRTNVAKCREMCLSTSEFLELGISSL
jgi:predicted hydrolase (HD superfamily)